jgi:hypothetical protein
LSGGPYRSTPRARGSVHFSGPRGPEKRADPACPCGWLQSSCRRGQFRRAWPVVLARRVGRLCGPGRRSLGRTSGLGPCGGPGECPRGCLGAGLAVRAATQGYPLAPGGARPWRASAPGERPVVAGVGARPAAAHSRGRGRAPRVTVQRMRIRHGDVEADLAATGPEGTAEGGVSDRRAQTYLVSASGSSRVWHRSRAYGTKPLGEIDRARSPSKDKEANWLPAPEGEMRLALRLCGRKKEVADGTSKPLAVERVKSGHTDRDITVAALCTDLAAPPPRSRSSRASVWGATQASRQRRADRLGDVRALPSTGNRRVRADLPALRVAERQVRR